MEIELPDCVISYIFSKLSLKNLVKCSILSKQWLYEYGFKKDLIFDLYNMFDLENTIQGFPEGLQLFQSKCATSLDQFMLHYHGSIIRSVRVNFPLDDQHRDIIDRLITKVISKGVERIELLFSYKSKDTNLETEKYKFHFTLLSDPNSLTYLYLQNCHLVTPMDLPMDLSGLKNLITLVLHYVGIKQDMLQVLFSSCIHLVEFTIHDCMIESDLKIICPTLLHLNINTDEEDKARKRKNIDIITTNLSSFQYFCRDLHNVNIKAPMLSNFSFKGDIFPEHIGYSGLKNLTTIVLDKIISPDVVAMPILSAGCPQLEDLTLKNCGILGDMEITGVKNLQRLSIINSDYFYIGFDDITVDSLNLSSFEYSGHTMGRFFIKFPRLLTVFWNAAMRHENRYPFGPLAKLHQIQNLTIIINQSQITELSKILVQFHNLRQLDISIEGEYDPNMDYFWILDIAMASQHLQKLSLTIRNSHLENSHMVAFGRQRKEYAGFFHSNLKCVHFRGCVSTVNVIELASYILMNVNSLKRITFSPRDEFYIGAGSWSESNSCCWFKRSLIHEILRNEVNEQCQFSIL